MTIEEWLGKDNQLGIDIWKKKYQNNNETFEEWLDRVSNGDKDVRQLIVDKKFLFGGRILANRGIDKRVTYSNCYVISPPEDSIESIYDTCSKLARTFSYGGGCGIDISKLAPKGAKVNNAAKETSGAVSFMDTFSQVTGQIGQGGRRGALMISISCDHPDLEDFINIKTDLNRVNYANISVRVTDDFMQAVIDNNDWELKFKRKETGEVISKTVKAKDIFHLLCKQNWDYAEPGILFWDRISNWNILSEDNEFEYAGTNPCAEEPLPQGGSCLLGSINLAEFVDNNGHFMFDAFEECVHTAVIALNDVLDEGQPRHPLEEQRNSVRDWRQIGLGVMGIADMLIKMGIRYGSKESIDLCDDIGFAMANEAILTSSFLAENNGAFDKYKECILKSPYLIRNTYKNTDKYVEARGLRNSQLLTIAPTGTLSTMIGVSGGIEPIFANYYTRMTKSLHGEDVEYKVYTPIVKQYMEWNNITDDADLPDYFVTAKDIDFNDRIAMQAIWQEHIDASISSTINLPNEFTVEQVEQMYINAWESGLKGLTMFREGCARMPILSTEEKKEETVSNDSNELRRGDVEPPRQDLIGLKRDLTTGCGSLHVSAYFDPQTCDLKECFLSKGSNGGCNNYMIGLSRLISLSARAGVSVEAIVDQLNSTGVCPSYAVRHATKKDTSVGSCCAMAVGNALMDMWHQVKDVLEEPDEHCNSQIIHEEKIAKCPECGEPLIFEGGCNICKSCGWSKCL